MRVIPHIVAAAAMATFALALTAHASGAAPFALQEIAPGIFLHRGAHAGLEDPGRADSANIGFVIGDECIAVIDSGGAVITGERLRTAIQRISGKPICYVINTHIHFDHLLGNAALAADGVEFVGHGRLAEAVAANRAFFAEFFAAELGGGVDLEQRLTAPDTGVEAALELELGNRRLRLEAHPVAHTNTDLSVLDLETNTLWTGDLLFRERLPVVDGSLRGWLAWMQQAMTRDYAVVIPGHGPADTSWPAGAASQHAYLQALLKETRAAIAAGVMLQDAKDIVAREALVGWRLTERTHRLNVSRAFRELEWE